MPAASSAARPSAGALLGPPGSASSCTVWPLTRLMQRSRPPASNTTWYSVSACATQSHVWVLEADVDPISRVSTGHTARRATDSQPHTSVQSVRHCPQWLEAHVCMPNCLVRPAMHGAPAETAPCDSSCAGTSRHAPAARAAGRGWAAGAAACWGQAGRGPGGPMQAAAPGAHQRGGPLAGRRRRRQRQHSDIFQVVQLRGRHRRRRRRQPRVRHARAARPGYALRALRAQRRPRGQRAAAALAGRLAEVG